MRKCQSLGLLSLLFPSSRFLFLLSSPLSCVFGLPSLLWSSAPASASFLSVSAFSPFFPCPLSSYSVADPFRFLCSLSISPFCITDVLVQTRSTARMASSCLLSFVLHLFHVSTHACPQPFSARTHEGPSLLLRQPASFADYRSDGLSRRVELGSHRHVTSRGRHCPPQ